MYAILIENRREPHEVTAICSPHIVLGIFPGTPKCYFIKLINQGEENTGGLETLPTFQINGHGSLEQTGGQFSILKFWQTLSVLVETDKLVSQIAVLESKKERLEWDIEFLEQEIPVRGSLADFCTFIKDIRRRVTQT